MQASTDTDLRLLPGSSNNTNALFATPGADAHRGPQERKRDDSSTVTLPCIPAPRMDIRPCDDPHECTKRIPFSRVWYWVPRWVNDLPSDHACQPYMATKLADCDLKGRPLPELDSMPDTYTRRWTDGNTPHTVRTLLVLN